jgi:hypothetical protein
MGLFSSSSRNTQSASYETVTNTDQTDQSGNSGLNFSRVGDVDLSDRSTTTLTTISTDQGALRVAGGLGEAAFSFAGAGLDNAQAANAGALSFGRSALDNVARVNADSLSLLGGLITGAIDSSRTLARDAIEGFGSLATRNSASTDDRVTKLAGFALAAVAAAFILPAIWKK